MGILGGLNTDFFTSTAPQPKVKLDQKSVMICVTAFIGTSIQKNREEIQSLEYATWATPDYVRGKTNQCEQRIAILSGWKDLAVVDRRLTNILSIKGLVKVWGELTPHVPFLIGRTPYIIAQTEDVILADEREQWNLGPYMIMLPLGGQVGEMHWVPVRDPECRARHPHHGLLRSYDGEPREANTCLGTFHSYVETALRMGDIVSLLRFMTDYIKSYNPASPLYHIEDIQHARHL
jgi:hypothetical protein